ncbi:MAG: M20 family metallo-hydrolase [Pseudomonadota bacterium]
MVGFLDASRKIDDLTDRCTDFLARICSIPALGPDNQGTGEMEKYRVIRDMVRSIGPDSEMEVHAPDDRVPDGVRPNLLALFNGTDSGRTLWILTHMDVVPPGEPGLWDFDPFSPFVKDGFLFGRGVEDNGQSLAASIFAVKAVKETCGPAVNVGLAIVSDEETGSRYGLEYVLDQRPELFRPDDLILVPDAGNQEGNHVEIAEKHFLQARFRVVGSQGHASRPDLSRNAFRAAAHLVTDLDRVLKERFDQRNAFFNPPDSTFEPTRCDRTVPNVNTIPGETVFYYDCRVLPEVELSAVTEVMREAARRTDEQFGVTTSVDEHLAFQAPTPTQPDAPVVVALAQALQEVYGVQARPVGIGGQTVAAFFRKKGLPAAVWEKVLQYAHAPNEKISLDNLLGNAKVFARMML